MANSYQTNCQVRSLVIRGGSPQMGLVDLWTIISVAPNAATSHNTVFTRLGRHCLLSILPQFNFFTYLSASALEPQPRKYLTVGCNATKLKQKNMQKKITIIFLLMNFLNSVCYSTNLNSAQISLPPSILSNVQLCIGINNAPTFKNGNQIYYIDSAKIQSISSTSIQIFIYTRDSTNTCNIAPFVNSNYNFCMQTLPPGNYTVNVAEINQDICSNFGGNAYNTGQFNLTVNCAGTPTFSTINISNCDTVFYNNNFYLNSTTLVTVIPNSVNCDSTITTNIIVNHSSPFTIINDTICNGQTFQFGTNLYSLSGTYNLSSSNINGCDSNSTLNLFVKPAVDTTITQIGNALFANQSNVTYQWYNCNTNSLINGQTNQFYAPTVSGSYATLLNNGTCIDTTICFSFIPTNLEEINNKNSIKIFPNPSFGKFSIESSISIQNLNIFDLQGRVIKLKMNSSNEVQILTTSNGIYILEIELSNKKKYYKKIEIVND
jgi:hypothetical protein